jgi:indolepyruvate ferredoxin oxidoreductase beta subunit
MKQQIVISGTGGQGVLFVTRVIAEAALREGHPVLTSETHGMAMRGGTVISHVKIGDFRSPLIRTRQADVGLFLARENLPAHSVYLRPDGRAFVNAPGAGEGNAVDAAAIANALGNIVILNLVLLGFAARSGRLFCGADVLRSVVKGISSSRQRELNLKAFDEGLRHEGGR